MKIKGLFFAFIIVLSQQLTAQVSNKITGPLGLYHISPGYTYTDTTGADSALIQYQFRFGELNMPDQAFDNGFDFVPEIDSCVQWNVNRVFAILQPPTEHGVYNQPADTALYAPYPQLDGPGMIQGGQRFSRLSQLYGGFSGVVLDDWAGDTSVARQVRDAVRGKYVDAEGNVHSECVAATPYNKVYAVVYNTGANPAAMPVIDGLSYWYFANQNCCYTAVDSDISTLRSNYPGKEIVIGIYLKNSTLGWTDPAGVQYLLQHTLDRYDDGDINGITIFAGVYLLKDYMPLSEWNAFALPYWLDSLYYPFLGQGQGKVTDCTTGNALTGVSVRAFYRGRLSGDTLMRSYQQSDENGQYQFGLWAGNRNTDSSYYWMIAEKDGYTADTVGFWIKRNSVTTIPDFALCAVPDTIPQPASQMLVYPNPTNGKFTVEVNTEPVTGDELEVYNMLGEKVSSTPQVHRHTHLNLSMLNSGAYLVFVKTNQKKVGLKQLVMLQH